MSLEDKVKMLKLPHRPTGLKKFILVNINNDNYFHISSCYYGMIEHKKMLEDIMKKLNLPFDINSKSLTGENYRIISMGICKINKHKQELKLFGQSYYYNVDLTEEGYDIIKSLFPRWKIISKY